MKEVMYSTHGPVRTKDGDYVILNRSRENQGCIHSFKSLRQNIKHGCLPQGEYCIGLSMANGMEQAYSKNKYHILEYLFV